MIQETYLRWQAVATDSIDTPRAWLTTVITRLCLDHLRSAKVQREAYFGPWLPEPILDDRPEDHATLADSLSMAFLVVLESLSPVERAVYLLREVFEYDYADIAPIVEKSDANCRQIFRRAKTHISEHRPRYQSTDAQAKVEAFVEIVMKGDVAALESILAEDVQLWSDGGGKVHAAPKPLYGRDIVLRYLKGTRQILSAATLRIEQINGDPGIVIDIHGRVFGVVMLTFDGDELREIRNIINPEKLKHVQN